MIISTIPQGWAGDRDGVTENSTKKLKYTQSQKDSQFVDPVLGLGSTSSTALRLRLCSVSSAGNSFCDWV
jgi:hypothetical protein